jgi:hypothetical protein
MSDLIARFDLFENDISIYDICLELRMSWNGSSDPMDKDDEKKALEYLRITLGTWKEDSIGLFETAFDNAVKNLIICTLQLNAYRKINGLTI